MSNSTSISFSYVVVNSTILSIAANSIANAIPDCIPTTINTSMLNFSFNGGVQPWMIDINSLPSQYNDVLLRTQPQNGTFNYNFTLQDIYDGLVVLRPALLTSVGSNRSVSIPFYVRDPAGRLVSGSLSATIIYTYCPLPFSSTTNITSNNGQVAMIDITVLSIYEAHNMFLGDINWSVPSLSVGVFEYYCPDNSCGGPGWVQMGSLTQFSMVLHLMN